MVKNHFNSILLRLVIISAGGLLMLAICYVLYFAVYMLVESVFYTNDPTLVPAGIIRNSFTGALIILYLALLRTKIPDNLKAAISTGPIAMLMIVVILALYLTPVLAAASTAAIAVCCIFLLYRYKKPWFYYYATAISVIAAIAYAWPRA